MADAYKQWLQEQVAYYRAFCIQQAHERGYTGADEAFAIRNADQVYREILDTYEDCLSEYEKFTSPSLPADHGATP